jgi:aconitate hydratase
MPHLPNPFNTLRSLNNDNSRFYYSLPALDEQGLGKVRRLPVSIRIMLESLLRNCDGKRVKEEDVLRLAKWNAKNPGDADVPFVVSRVILQDFTGVPLLVDLAAMRDAMAEKGFDAKIIEPQVPVDLVVDHSVQVDRSGTEDAFLFNLKIEFDRNRERYEFLKWGQGAFDAFKVVPPGIGIVHQVNLEHIASVVTSKKEDNATVFYPDTLVGTDSHTTMINGLGVVGWGVGGIEAEAAMLGQPVAMQTPEVVGFYLHGKLQEGVTATDLTLRITEILRKEKVVGKFVEFFGEGAASLTVADRATIGNMSPEYGATMGFFPADEKTLDYLQMTGRDEKHIAQVKEYLHAQQLFGIPKKDEIDYSKVVELDLNTVTPCVSGPKRPQDRIDLSTLKSKFHELLSIPIPEGGYGKAAEKQAPKIFVHSNGSFSLNAPHGSGGQPYIDNNASVERWSESEMVTNRPVTKAVVNPGYSEHPPADAVLTHGSVVIAAITSCTNTSNPSVMVGAGLLAKKAVEKGLKVNHTVKTSLAPGSRVVTDYLDKTGLQKYLDELGFQLVAYGCTTCIGNSGPLDEKIEKTIKDHDLIAASVLSGNRNFEARIHSSVKANFLMSPPLVVAFALAGRVDINLDEEPLGMDRNGKPVYLKDIWPSSHEIQEAIAKGLQPEMFKKRYANILEDNPVWKQISTKKSLQYAWDEKSTYIQQPPYFEDFRLEIPQKKEFKGMRALALFGDSVTTDHISPAGAFRGTSPAGKYLLSLGVPESDFNSYGSRRGNHFVMMRGTFANVRIYNKMAGGKEGGYTKLVPEGEILPIFDACQIYAEKKVPLIVFAGKDYGMGSSRDWAAKGTALLGVRVVVARSFERIHRSNLIGMGVLPLEFQNDESLDSLKLTGDETFSISGLEQGIKPHQEAVLEIARGDKVDRTKLLVRIDTPTELEYFQHGGILPFMLRQLISSKR